MDGGLVETALREHLFIDDKIRQNFGYFGFFTWVWMILYFDEMGFLQDDKTVSFVLVPNIIIVVLV